MAITSYEIFFDKNAPKSSCSKSSILNTFSSMQNSYTKNTSLTSSNNKYNNIKIDKYISPYLSDEKAQLQSRVTEKKFLHKSNDFLSSFPLAVNIYKANSDDLRSSKRCSKKVKKSVLTLPNEPAPLPQTCTVSDMNDSEYFNDDIDSQKAKTKKRRADQSRRKSRGRNKQIDLYDTNAKYYSQLDNDFDKSSKEMFNFTGSTTRKSKKSQNNNLNVKSNFNAHDVWSLLRNVNQFKFRPSPPVSQESSVVSVKKMKRRKNNKQRNNRKDTRLIETCRTEEFAYISSFVDNPRNSCSQSSFDRITVIEKQNEIQTTKCNGVEKGVSKSTFPYIFSYGNETTQNVDSPKKPKSKQSHMKVIYSDKSNDNFFNSKKLGTAPIQSKDVILHGKNKKQHNNKKTLQNDFDNNKNNFIEINLNNDIDMIQNNQHNDLVNNCNFSEKSDSSKEPIRMSKSNKISNKDLGKLTPNKSQQHMAGITKVVLSKDQNIILSKQATALQRKSLLMNSTPFTSVNHKVTLTLSEIKRRLCSIKFPLIVLGKDQLSSTITVENYDPPQFAGLDEHIWPFMRIWNGKNYHNLFDTNNGKTNYSDEALNLNNNVKNIHYTINDKINSYPKVENRILKDKHNVSPTKDDKFKKPLAQIKPMQRIKNKMMQFIHKKIVSENEVCNNKCEQNQVIKIVDVGINTTDHFILLKQDNPSLQRDEKILKKNSFINSHAKTKGKWASDFIENVIRKIKSGVYYCQDDKDEFKEHRKKDDGVQREIENLNSQPLCHYVNVDERAVSNEIDPVVSVPGFDNKLSDLEIETLNNFNRIAVKNCVANIIIHFDVAISFENNRIHEIKESYPCTPISLVKNQPLIFKCKTTIINAILPAELCSILPKLMEKIIHSNSKLNLSTSAIDKVNSNLSRISELASSEADSNKYLLPVCIDPKLKLKVVSEGHFSSRPISKNIERGNMKLKSQQSFDLVNIKGLLIAINTNLLPFSHREPVNFLNHDNKLTHKQFLPSEDIQHPKGLSPCKALQLYQFSAKKILPTQENYSFLRIVQNILSSQNLRFNLSPTFNNNVKVVFYKNSLNICFVDPAISQLNSPISNVKIDDYHNGLGDNLVNVDNLLVTSRLNSYNAVKAITNNMNSISTSKLDKRKNIVVVCKNNTRNKKRGFVKLYKKCRSMSSISTNRSNMNLDKINNLDEFYLALGSGKMLSGVLDGNAGRKILSSIREIKNWLTDITPRQALLVLLLANKKDTSNLVRYRPIILQGIAVNRITRASELDMEIEVIERENLNKLTQYEGITYLLASEENQDTLLEELCWIAKTTASDYQKPFDESSERLLKNLLEKRKKLNPSYLRVMARYVGLGLLKTSNNRN